MQVAFALLDERRVNAVDGLRCRRRFHLDFHAMRCRHIIRLTRGGAIEPKLQPVQDDDGGYAIERQVQIERHGLAGFERAAHPDRGIERMGTSHVVF